MISFIGNLNFNQSLFLIFQPTQNHFFELIGRTKMGFDFPSPNALFFRFKSLTVQEKLDVITIRDRDFIEKFLKFSA